MFRVVGRGEQPLFALDKIFWSSAMCRHIPGARICCWVWRGTTKQKPRGCENGQAKRDAFNFFHRVSLTQRRESVGLMFTSNMQGEIARTNTHDISVEF